MSHLNCRSFRHSFTPAPTPGAIEGRQQRSLRSLTAALFSSLCLISCFAAAAQASAQQQTITAAPTPIMFGT